MDIQTLKNVLQLYDILALFYLVVPVHGGEVALANTNTSHIEAGAEGEGWEDQDRGEGLPHHDAGLDVSLPSVCSILLRCLSYNLNFRFTTQRN